VQMTGHASGVQLRAITIKDPLLIGRLLPLFADGLFFSTYVFL